MVFEVGEVYRDPKRGVVYRVLDLNVLSAWGAKSMRVYVLDAGEDKDDYGRGHIGVFPYERCIGDKHMTEVEVLDYLAAI